jgi:polyadenylation factor subunit 2
MGFNFETIMQAHDCAIRDARYSHGGDWLLSCDLEGHVKYWQPNFNNVNDLQAHSEEIYELAFAPTDAKFVTASHDTTLKVWDFSGGIEEATLQGHGWEARTVDWHPTKGLICSGSKDHQVKLWDPRNGRCLTTLHSHKNTIQKVSFSPVNGDMLATCARDHTGRIFDLRMMRDVLLLKGHETGFSTLAWHPQHKNLLSVGFMDGCLSHYLLDEPNTPAESSNLTASTAATGEKTAAMTISPTNVNITTVPPYETSDPSNAPSQSIYPTHRIPTAHEFSPLWTLSWHPLGHILASGGNDKMTRFWARARPGHGDYLKDRYHVGKEGAEALGTWKKDMDREKEEEEREEEDEREGLVDQKMPSKNQTSLPGLASLPGLPGLGPANAGGVGTAQDGTSTGGAQPQSGILPPPFLPGQLPAGFIPPPPLGQHGTLPFHSLQPPTLQSSQANNAAATAATALPPPFLPPGAPPPLPPDGVDPAQFFRSLQAAGIKLPIPIPPLGAPSQNSSTATPPSIPGGLGMPPLQDSAQTGGVRKRAPLPSQQESLMEERRRGNYRTAR